MRRLAILAGILVIYAVGFGQEAGPGFWVRARVGYTSFQLSDLHNLMYSGVTWYNFQGIPVEMQTNFPGNILGGGEVYCRVWGLRIGAGIYGTNTMGFFGAKDVSGILKVKSSYRLLVVQALLGFDIDNTEDRSWFVMVKPGYAFGTWDFRESVFFNDYGLHNVDNRLDGETKGFGVDAVIGLEYRITSIVSIEGEAGYRATGAPKVTIAGMSSDLGLNSSGFIVSASLGIRL